MLTKSMVEKELCTFRPILDITKHSQASASRNMPVSLHNFRTVSYCWKTEDNRFDALYSHAKDLRGAKNMQITRSQTAREQEETKECTFRPRINKPVTMTEKRAAGSVTLFRHLAEMGLASPPQEKVRISGIFV